jgi:hypothetical protein
VQLHWGGPHVAHAVLSPGPQPGLLFWLGVKKSPERGTSVRGKGESRAPSGGTVHFQHEIGFSSTAFLNCVRFRTKVSLGRDVQLSHIVNQDGLLRANTAQRRKNATAWHRMLKASRIA